MNGDSSCHLQIFRDLVMMVATAQRVQDILNVEVTGAGKRGKGWSQ